MAASWTLRDGQVQEAALAGNRDRLALIASGFLPEYRTEGSIVLLDIQIKSFNIGPNGDPIVQQSDGTLYEFLLSADRTYTGGRRRL